MATTTERERPGRSVRVRLTAGVALLTLFVLAGVGLVVYAVESQRIDAQVADRIDQQFEEFAAFERADGATYPTVGALLDAFLDRQVTDDFTTLVAWYDGAPQKVSFGGYVGDPAVFEDTARGIVDDNGTARIDDPDDELLLTAQTVQRGDQTGALVVVTYLGDARAGLGDTVRTFVLVALVGLVLTVGVAAAQSGRLLAPLRTLRETAEEISDTDLSRRLPEVGNDDITALTRTFNSMLDRLEAAFTGQRQFLDDAGHELRTPLTVLRGHLELLDVGDPREVAETQALLLDEVDRMSRLVGDLILLAKSDRPDFVTLRPVDLTTLTVDALAKARGLGERRWVLDQTASSTVAVDEQRLTQALLQLCDNAVKHTTEDDTVALGSARSGREVRLWVRDTGPGVPADQREHVFERFGRADVAPDDEGFGLGLAIVSAIAHAHGGRVELSDEQPHGARFTLVVPVEPEPGGDHSDHTDHAPPSADRTQELTAWPAS